MTTTTLSAGTYYIGDLVYFLLDESFDGLCQQFKNSPYCQLTTPNGTAEGLNFWTEIGDGTFNLSSGESVIVDSASVGICKIDCGSIRLKSGFSVVTFSDSFECWVCDGVIHFGRWLSLDTNYDSNEKQ